MTRRDQLIEGIGVIVQSIVSWKSDNHYQNSDKHNTQFVGRVPLSQDEVESRLKDIGFVEEPNKLSDSHNSWRMIDSDDGAEMQLQVTLYDSRSIETTSINATFVYATMTKRWDTHPIEYYRNDDSSGPIGVKRMKNMLDAEGIVYDLIRP